MPHVELHTPIHCEEDREIVSAVRRVPLLLLRHLNPTDERAEDLGREHADVDVLFGIRDELLDQSIPRFLLVFGGIHRSVFSDRLPPLRILTTAIHTVRR